MAAVILQPERLSPSPRVKTNGHSPPQLDHHGGDQHGHDADDLQGPQRFTNKKHRKQDGKHRLQAAGDDGARGIKVFQSAEIKHVRQHHGETGKDEQESPLRPAEVLRNQFPGRINHGPHDGRAQQQIKHDSELMVSRHQALCGDVIKRIAKRCQQSGRYGDQAEFHAGLKNADCQGRSDHGDQCCRGALKCCRFPAPRDHINQYPERRGVLHGDRQRDCGFLNRIVIEKIGAGHAQRADKRTQDQVTPGNGKDAAAKSQQEEWGQKPGR